jgi:hypothetical protein
MDYFCLNCSILAVFGHRFWATITQGRSRKPIFISRVPLPRIASGVHG